MCPILCHQTHLVLAPAFFLGADDLVADQVFPERRIRDNLQAVYLGILVEYGSDKDGPNEDLVIAALLHDAVEDQGGIDAWSQFVDPSVLRY